MTKPLLSINGLHKQFGELTALEDFDLNIMPGEFVSVIGPSGCGKSVLLRMIAGLLSPNQGKIIFSDADASRVALSFQSSCLLPWLNLEDNIRVCMNSQALSAKDKAGLLKHYFEYAHLNGFEKAYPHQISGGMQQKVNVIRAFCAGTKLILMDEPFVSLDFPQRLELQNLTLDLCNKENKTVLFVTHDIDEAIYLSDRILVLSQRPGKILTEIAVPLTRPRSIDTLRKSAAYLDLYSKISACLLGEHQYA